MYYIALLLLSLLLKIVTAEQSLHQLVCEDETLFLGCPNGYAINITTALYGRKDSSYCSGPGSSNTNCAAGNALGITKLLCNRKQNCRVQVSNNVFSDPCYGTRKYLEVTYKCVPEQSLHQLVCEDETLFLGCPNGYAINITTALYGRKDSSYCSGPGSSNTNCAAGNALGITKLLCNRKQNCHVQGINNVFSDPCYGTRKYLEVTYKCVPVNMSSSVACEDDKLKINCTDGYYLRIVNALYGRTDAVTCLKPGKPVLTNNCGAPTALNILASRCNNLKQCTIDASNGIFGDPCYGTYKYLKVDYQCLTSMSANRP